MPDDEPGIPGRAWTPGDLRDPHGAQDKARRVRAMFAAIAPAYDLNNRLHSLGRDQAWRRRAVTLAELRPDDVVLDVACGTADLALAFARAGARRVIGVDFTIEMLGLARTKAARPAVRRDAPPGVPPALWLAAGDATRLPVPDASADIVSIAFGLRNVDRPQHALAEFHRVLRPGGRAIVLEFDQPDNRLLRGLYQAYFQHVLPRTAGWIARDRAGAYRYLPRSVNTFLSRRAMVELLGSAGFRGVRATPLTFGIAVAYRGVKPPEAAAGDGT